MTLRDFHPQGTASCITRDFGGPSREVKGNLGTSRGAKAAKSQFFINEVSQAEESQGPLQSIILMTVFPPVSIKIYLFCEEFLL